MGARPKTLSHDRNARSPDCTGARTGTIRRNPARELNPDGCASTRSEHYLLLVIAMRMIFIYLFSLTGIFTTR